MAIMVTAVLAITVFIIVQVVAVIHHGPKYYINLLFPKSALQFNPSWQPGGAIRLGETMASYAGNDELRG